MTNFQTVCRVSDVPDGSSQMFIVDQVPVGPFNRQAGPNAGQAVFSVQANRKVFGQVVDHLGR